MLMSLAPVKVTQKLMLSKRLFPFDAKMEHIVFYANYFTAAFLVMG